MDTMEIIYEESEEVTAEIATTSTTTTTAATEESFTELKEKLFNRLSVPSAKNVPNINDAIRQMLAILDNVMDNS